MSRSKAHKKAPGYEFWSKRPVSNRWGCPPGKYSKQLTHRLERAEARTATRELADTAQDDACDLFAALYME